jgi:hypothetical protein
MPHGMKRRRLMREARYVGATTRSEAGLAQANIRLRMLSPNGTAVDKAGHRQNLGLLDSNYL